MFAAILVAQTLLSVPVALYHSGDHLYSLAKTDSDALLMLDYESGRLSRLRLNETEWVGGPSIGVESLIAVRVKISANTMTISVAGGVSPAAERPRTTAPTQITATRVDAFATEHVSGGTLYLPRTPGTHPAVVAVPGAAILSVPYFGRRGIAVLVLEKRSNWQSRTFEDIADDVIAAATTLQSRKDINRRSIGVYASSEGGWVAPIAAAKSSAIAFVVCGACPATNLTTQELIRTNAELRADGFSAAEVEGAVRYRKLFFEYLQSGEHQGELEAADQKAKSARWYPRFGGVISREAPLALWWQRNDRYVPADSWKRVHVPALLLFGGLDTRVPPSQHAQRIAAADPAATVMIIPNIDHEGFIARTGGRDEVPLLDRIPPQAFEPMIEWILALKR